MSHQALLFCTDEKTTRVVTQVLTELDFVVEPCCEPFVAVKKLMATQFDAIVVDCDNEQNATLLFKSARNSGSNQGSLAVAVVEGQAGVAKAFRIGANLVLTKPINVEQSKGTLRVARGLLKKAEAGKPATAATSSAEQPSRLGAGTLDQTRSTGAPPASAQKSVAAAPFAALRTPANFPVPASTAVSSSFEVAHDATPKPRKPAEAAFLESIPDPLGNKPAAHVPEILGTSQKTKSPWQPLSGSIGETKGSVPGTNPDLGSVSTGRRPFSTGGLSNPGAGTAAAPAKGKEAPPPASKSRKPAYRTYSTLHEVHEVAAEKSLPQGETTGDAPHFAESAHETKSSKMPLIAAIVVIAMAAAGYFGWSKMHMGHSPSVAQEPTAAPAGSSPAASPVTGSGQGDDELVLQSPATTAQPQSATMQSQSQSTASQSQPTTRLNEQATQSATATPVSGKPAPGKPVAVDPHRRFRGRGDFSSQRKKPPKV